MTYPDLLQGTVKDPNEYLNPKVASTDRFIFSWMIKSWSTYVLEGCHEACSKSW